MKRIIKFRAWDKSRKRFTDDFLMRSDGEVGTYVGDDFDGTEWMTLDWYVIQQFTGLHDKNGKEIYEGDLLNFQNSVGEVWWQPNAGYWAIDWKPIPKAFLDYNSYHPIYHCLEYEVIGNIFENPELA